jgi:hypothetical protein
MLVSIERTVWVQGSVAISVALSEKLLSHVRSLTYASFHDDGTATAAEDIPLEPWQVAHASAVLRECKELENLRFVLCPKCAVEPILLDSSMS